MRLTKLTTRAILLIAVIGLSTLFVNLAPSVLAQQNSSITLACSPNPAIVNSSIALNVTVFGNDPSGTVNWATNSTTGVFNSTKSILISGTSQVIYNDSSPGNKTISASYSGNANNPPSNATLTIKIYPSIDFDHDGKIGYSEVVQFIGAYVDFNKNGRYNSTFDLNCDGSINFYDVILFSQIYTISQNMAPTTVSSPIAPIASTHASNPNNLTPFPKAWEHPSIGGTSTGHSLGNPYANDANLMLDQSTLYNGNPTIRIDPTGSTSNHDRECDGPWAAVKPGDHIVFTAWMKTTASSVGDTNPWGGIRIGIDFFGPNGDITGTNSPDGSVWSPWGGWPPGQTTVRWGTSTWTQITIDFIVQSRYTGGPSGIGYKYSPGQIVTPTCIAPWVQVCGSNDQGQAWFANTQLYINP